MNKLLGVVHEWMNEDYFLIKLYNFYKENKASPILKTPEKEFQKCL